VKLTPNPTRTRSIEAAWLREIRRRWAEYSRRTLARLAVMNAEAVITNAEADPFVMSVQQQNIYMAYVQEQIDALLLGGAEPPNWQAQYQLQSYERALTQIRGELVRQGARIVPTEAERLIAEGLEPFTATPTLATGPTAAPVHRDALQFLYTRSYDALQGWTAALARQTREILFDGVQLGQNSRVVAQRLQERIDVSASRARTIAQTETNQAYSRASIAEIDRAAEEVGEPIKTRWITARDARVRHSHAELHGVVMTTERAQRVKIEDGINCRCALVPVVPGTNTARRAERFDKERAMLLLLERK
jgi:SPP1 gp7 family putative phage head morphogenesis protein